MEFAKRMERFQPGIFSVLLELKNKRLAGGKGVIDLSVGTPNIPPAPHIIKALTSAAGDPKNYVYAIGDTKELQKAAALWYDRRYGVRLDPETQVMSLLGSQDGLAHIALTVADEGDVVLVPDPCYPAFADGVRLSGAEIAYMPQRPENGSVIDLEEIPEATRRRAKLMIVSYPNNPTTALAPPEFYKELILFAQKYGIIVLHDNAYSDLVFDGARCGSFLAYDGAMEVGVEFNSLSKTYGLAGARIGFCVGNAEVVQKLSKLKSNLDYGMFLPVQQAAIAAITGDQRCVESTCKAYERRRDVLCAEFLNAGWELPRPKATMFVWAKLPKGFADSQDFALRLLKETGVMVTPGTAFGPSGQGFIRLALVQDEGTIRRAAGLIRESGILG